MTQVLCGANDVTASVADPGGISTMHILVTTNGVGCHFAMTFSGATCTKVEEHDGVVGNDGTVTYAGSGGGITSCASAACTFNANDAACAVGDRANAQGTARLSGDEIVTTSPPTAGLCARYNLPTTIRYTRE